MLAILGTIILIYLYQRRMSSVRPNISPNAADLTTMSHNHLPRTANSDFNSTNFPYHQPIGQFGPNGNQQVVGPSSTNFQYHQPPIGQAANPFAGVITTAPYYNSMPIERPPERTYGMP